MKVMATVNLFSFFLFSLSERRKDAFNFSDKALKTDQANDVKLFQISDGVDFKLLNTSGRTDIMFRASNNRLMGNGFDWIMSHVTCEDSFSFSPSWPVT